MCTLHGHLILSEEICNIPLGRGFSRTKPFQLKKPHKDLAVAIDTVVDLENFSCATCDVTVMHNESAVDLVETN